MSSLIRFGVSLNKELLKKFDLAIKQRGYPTRSKAIEDFVRETISNNRLNQSDTSAIGSIDLLYDHHKRELLQKITSIQHDYENLIITSQHVHISHSHCYEIIIVKGKRSKLIDLANKLKAVKGVEHSALRITGTDSI